jgi:hypothetical protein
MTKNHHLKSDRIEFWKWVLAHTVAYPFAILLGLIVVDLLLELTDNLLPEIYASGLAYVLWASIIGGIIGLVQWRFLRDKTTITSGWILSGVIGFAIAELLSVVVLLIYGIDRNIGIGGNVDILFSLGTIIWTITYFVGGSITGYLQSSYLKNITPYFRYWTLTNGIIWGVSTFVGTGIIPYTGMGFIIGIILVGPVLGVLSKLALNKFFKYSNS